MLKIGSLFAGVGGLELGLEWAGVGRVVWQVEQDRWCRGVLAMHWPNAQRFKDVRHVGRHSLASVDVICGGFPCQDISRAGKGAGLEGARSGLWSEYARIVGELRPLVVVVENVAALVARGLDRVVGDLAELGYDVHGRIVAASDVGAPHRRERIFLVAHARRFGGEGGSTPPLGEHVADARDHGRELVGEGHDFDGKDALGDDADRRDPHVADADGKRVREQQQRVPGGRARSVRDSRQALAVDDGAASWGRAQSGVGRGAHGLPARVDRWPARPGDVAAVWEPPRAVTSYSPTRAARLHALGNAVVPQVAAEVGAFVLDLLGR